MFCKLMTLLSRNEFRASSEEVRPLVRERFHLCKFTGLTFFEVTLIYLFIYDTSILSLLKCWTVYYTHWKFLLAYVFQKSIINNIFVNVFLRCGNSSI